MSSHPPILYGTAWKEEETRRCVEQAISAGFRGIDTANQRKHYFEAAIGEALEKAWSGAGLNRRDFFLQTKFTHQGGQDHRLPYDPDAPLTTQVRQSFESSLEHLRTDYLDSYVLHGPSSSRGLPAGDWEVWRQMEEIQEAGKARHLGISNVNLEQLRSLWEGARIKPSFVQNRCYAATGWDLKIRAFCSEHGIVYQGFSLLTANPAVISHPDFLAIVRRIGCTPAQGVFAFSLQAGMLPLTGTTDPIHMREDLEALELHLSEADVRTIEGII